MNPLERGLLKSVDAYQTRVIIDGGYPTTSEMVREGLLEAGLGGTSGIYSGMRR